MWIWGCKKLYITKQYMKPWKIESGWFSEIDTMWPWLSLSLKAKQVLCDFYSEYQHIVVFESESFWKVLVLDWVIQLTERDEYSYQEMMMHIPLYVHKNPKNILIIWGWDGGMIRECVKHKNIESIILCEIDQWVIDASKKFLPFISSGFDDDRVEVIVWDGAKFVNNTQKKFDVIIIDSSDPIWPAESLYKEAFYKQLKTLLRDGWVITLQWESLFLHKDLATELSSQMKELFAYAQYAQIYTPTYPGGSIWLLTCSDAHNPSNPSREVDDDIQKQLKYYSHEMHKAAFVLPYGCRKL